MKSRKEYMKGEISHDEYYSQFVNDDIIDYVRRTIGEERIKESKDKYFNNIPLRLWDNMQGDIVMMCGRKLKDVSNGGVVSLSDCVCVAKQAARMIKDE